MKKILFIIFINLLPLCGLRSYAQSTYEVKKKDTVYGIARQYGISIEELMAANPEMKSADFKLKKGMTIVVPKGSKAVSGGSKAVSEVSIVPQRRTKAHQAKYTVGVMLPLHDENGDGKRMVEYYRGLLMGCDSLRYEGINTEVYALNVPETVEDVRVMLLDDKMKKCDVIFGPLYTKQVGSLADFCKKNDIKLVIPFAIWAHDVNTNDQVWQVYEPKQRMYDMSHACYMERFKDCNAVFVDCNDTTSKKGPFTFGLRKLMEQKGITYQITNLNSSPEMFRKAFVEGKRNVVILNTEKSPQLNLTFRKLNVLSAAYPELQISMFGYTEWLLYESTYRKLFHQYDVYLPSTYYYYKGLARIKSLEQNYSKWFNTDMQTKYIPRLALTGYDQVRFFVEGLWKYGSEFNGSKDQQRTSSLQNPLRFEKVGANGGWQNNAFMLVHYKQNGVIEKLEY